MKKIFFTMALVVISATAMQAQYFGLKGGVNFSNLNIDDVDNEYITGFHAGGYVNIPISESLSFQPELLYASKGNSARYDALFLEGDAKLRLDYLEVPLLAVLHLGDFVQLQAGPYLGFLVNSSYDVDGDIEDQDDLDNDNFKAFDFGLSGGLAFNISMLQVGARYNYGLSEVANSDEADFVLGDAKNGSFQIYGAIRIGDLERE